MARIDNHRKYCATVSYASLNCGSLREVSQKYGVSKSSLWRWVNYDPQCVGHQRARKDRMCPRRIIRNVVMDCMLADPYCTALELISQVHRRFGFYVSQSTISRCRKDCNLRYKRVQQTQKAEDVDSNHPFIVNDYYDGEISVDESSFYKHEHPIMGWGPGKERVARKAARGRVRVSLLVAIDQSGIVHSEIRNGGYNGNTYARFLAHLPEGRTIIADNAKIHKTEEVFSAAASRDQKLVFIPPYSPAMNPVEHVFSKTKAAYRRARLRGHVHWKKDVRRALATITPNDCEGYFRGARAARMVAKR